MGTDKVEIDPIKNQLMLQSMDAFRKTDRLSGQSPIVLTIGKVLPLNQGSADLFFFDGLFPENDAGMHGYNTAFIPDFDKDFDKLEGIERVTP